MINLYEWLNGSENWIDIDEKEEVKKKLDTEQK